MQEKKIRLHANLHLAAVDLTGRGSSVLITDDLPKRTSGGRRHKGKYDVEKDETLVKQPTTRLGHEMPKNKKAIEWKLKA